MPEEPKILLALGIATDEMMRHVHMFPEIFYMDVTCKLNRQTRNLFVMVLKDASGEAFPDLSRCLFIGMYGPKTIGRNRLSLTDDDMSEHGLFHNCINTMDCYRLSRHMLCVFHVLVMDYSKQVYLYLPHRGSKRNRKLTKKGSMYGE